MNKGWIALNTHLYCAIYLNSLVASYTSFIVKSYIFQLLFVKHNCLQLPQEKERFQVSIEKTTTGKPTKAVFLLNRKKYVRTVYHGQLWLWATLLALNSSKSIDLAEINYVSHIFRHFVPDIHFKSESENNDLYSYSTPNWKENLWQNVNNSENTLLNAFCLLYTTSLVCVNPHPRVSFPIDF